MATTTAYVRSANVVTRKIDGEILIVPVRSGVGDLASIFSFNEVGTFIWETLAQPCTEESLVECIFEAYETTTEQAKQDVDRFLTEMLSANLVETVTPGPSIAILRTPVSVEART